VASSKGYRSFSTKRESYTNVQRGQPEFFFFFFLLPIWSSLARAINFAMQIEFHGSCRIAMPRDGLCA
jgi:hypothetical protein